MHTNSSEIQQAGKYNHPGVHGIHNVTTIELEEEPALDAVIELNEEHTKRPSTSKLFKRNIRVGAMLIGME